MLDCRHPRSIAAEHDVRESLISRFNEPHLNAIGSNCRNFYVWVTSMMRHLFCSGDNERLVAQIARRTNSDTSQVLNCVQAGKRQVSTAAGALFRFIVPLTCLLSSPVYAASWTMNVDQRSGLPVLSKSGATAMSSNFVFWGKNWAWASLSEEFTGRCSL